MEGGGEGALVNDEDGDGDGARGGVVEEAVAVVRQALETASDEARRLRAVAFVVDDVAATFRVKVDGGRTHVHKADDASDVVVAKVTIPDGAQIGWHSHPGPLFGVNTGPGTLTSVHGDDCVHREVPPGSVLFDRGQHSVHGAFNNSGQEVVIYATFLGVQNGALIPAEPPGDCDPFP